MCCLKINYGVNYSLLSTSDDVLTEQAVLKWYNGAHVAKGKSVFLAQMKPMVDWLLTAEEESEEDQPQDSQTAQVVEQPSS